MTLSNNLELEVLRRKKDKQFRSCISSSIEYIPGFSYNDHYKDRNKKIPQIHTGYSGPATGKYYEEFRKEFNEQIDALLKK